MADIRYQANGLVIHTLRAPEGLIEAANVLDIGAGIRPMCWYKPERHVCVEPFAPYADRLEDAAYEVVRGSAEEALKQCDIGAFDAIYLLDSIEHMTRAEGFRVLGIAHALQPKQIVVYTPNGFLEQHGDAWGLGGEDYQEHRSGWTPADFTGWHIEHRDPGFFATWTRA